VDGMPGSDQIIWGDEADIPEANASACGCGGGCGDGSERFGSRDSITPERGNRIPLPLGVV